MSDPTNEGTLTEAISGKWHRLEASIRKGTFLIELSDTLLLNVHVNTKSIDILTLDDQGVFRYLADLSFEMLDSEKKFMLHSLGIDHIHFNNRDIRVDNPNHELSTVFVQLSLEKRKQTEQKLLGQ
jgi:hypothetical protein